MNVSKVDNNNVFCLQLNIQGLINDKWNCPNFVTISPHQQEDDGVENQIVFIDHTSNGGKRSDNKWPNRNLINYQWRWIDISLPRPTDSVLRCWSWRQFIWTQDHGDHETVGWPIHCSSHFTWAMTLHSSPWNMGLLPSNNYLDLSRIISKYHHSEKYLSSALQETIVHQQHQVNLYKNQDLITLRLASDLCLVMILL